MGALFRVREGAAEGFKTAFHRAQEIAFPGGKFGSAFFNRRSGPAKGTHCRALGFRTLCVPHLCRRFLFRSTESHSMRHMRIALTGFYGDRNIVGRDRASEMGRACAVGIVCVVEIDS